jgi:hypothetical protein
MENCDTWIYDYLMDDLAAHGVVDIKANDLSIHVYIIESESSTH